MTEERAAARIGDHSNLKLIIAQEVLRRAASMNVIGGHERLQALVEDLIDTWISLAADATQNGGRIYYGYPVDEALMRDPLSPFLRARGPSYERFKASRSMRDVEHVSSLQIVDPFGNQLS